MLIIVSAVFKQKQRLFLNSYLISSQKRPKGASFRPFSVVFLSFSVNFAIEAERSLHRDARGVRKAARVVMKLCIAERGLPRRREAQGSFFLFSPAVPDRHSSPPHKSHPSSAARPKRAARLIFARSSSEDATSNFVRSSRRNRPRSESSCARAQTSSPMRVSSRSSKWKKSGANCSSIDLRSSPRSSVSQVKIMR